MKGFRALTCSCCSEPGSVVAMVHPRVLGTPLPLHQDASCFSSGCELSNGAPAKQRSFLGTPHLESLRGDQRLDDRLSRRQSETPRLSGLQLGGISSARVSSVRLSHGSPTSGQTHRGKPVKSASANPQSGSGDGPCETVCVDTVLYGDSPGCEGGRGSRV